jgi:demethylmenaquinone methyltransferase / 2-methoxy-6-polyprenyl-1,4-benzoquinol methylase
MRSGRCWRWAGKGERLFVMNKNIQKLFGELPETYDLLNRILTWGLDILWRHRAVHQVCLAGKKRWIDICTGTGDMVISLKKHAPPETLVVGVDFSLPMLRKAVAKQKQGGISFVVADATALPFRADTFDAATISFATRNLNSVREHLTASFTEFHRILVRGGVFVNLETSQPEWRAVKFLSHAYVSLFVKPIGTLISGSRSGYTYLSQTIPRFFSATELSTILGECGFPTVTFKRGFFGIVAMHASFKKRADP